MLPSELLNYRQVGETLVPLRLAIVPKQLELAEAAIATFRDSVGKPQSHLDQQLLDLEGDSPNYRVKRGLAHLLRSAHSTFEIQSPLDPEELRQAVFSQAAQVCPSPRATQVILQQVADQLSQRLQREVLPIQIQTGLYADLAENRILTAFAEPTAEALLHRYNLSQVQGIFYKATDLQLNVHRNDPGEYKLLFRYLKLFQLLTYIEGDADHGFTITIDGPVSVFNNSTRYGLAIAKLIPALLHVTRWSLKARLQLKDSYSKQIKICQFTLEPDGGLVSHYPPGKAYDSMIEQAFAERWESLKTEWKLEREVDLIPIPGSVMIPDFRLVHPSGQVYLLEIVGYWRPEYLKKKFSQVRRAQCPNLILAISERLNLEKAGVKVEDDPAQIVWFKDRLQPKAILQLISQDYQDV